MLNEETPTMLDEEILSTVSSVFKVLSDPTRISLLNVLENKEINVGTLASTLSLEQSAVSHQLKILRSARLVKSRRVGKMMVYSQTDDHVYSILKQVILHAQEEN
ncbi:MAG: metalloregulator ArsR/SmtB family transcription factor [Carnobacterium sp.]|uniref:ArsR/SmtB family transcription factor n=1 Tax=Carnobacterium sp. TaxID=48221 RepID=UPI0033160FAF